MTHAIPHAAPAAAGSRAPAAGDEPAAALRGAHILVTGASGFIGRALCAELQAVGGRVRAVMRHASRGPWQEQTALDLAAGAPLPRGLLTGVDTVFHLAGRAHVLDELQQDEAQHQRVSVAATAALLAAATKAGVSSFVFMSSAAASTSADDGLDPRATRAVPETAYGRGKLAAERLVLDAGETSGLRGCNLRPVVVYGPGCRGNLPRMLEAIDRRRFPPVPDVGNRRSMVHVSDVVRAALLVAGDERAAGRTYHVTDGQTYSTRDIYLAMAAALGVRVPRGSAPVPLLTLAARVGDGIGTLRGKRFVFDSRALRTLLGSAYYDSSRLERELGFQARQTLVDALPAMIEDYRRSRAAA